MRTRKGFWLAVVASLLFTMMTALTASATAQPASTAAPASCPHPGYYDNTGWNIEVRVPMDVRSGPAIPCSSNGQVGAHWVVHLWCSINMPDGWWDFVSYPANGPFIQFKGWVPKANMVYDPWGVPCVPGG